MISQWDSFTWAWLTPFQKTKHLYFLNILSDYLSMNIYLYLLRLSLQLHIYLWKGLWTSPQPSTPRPPSFEPSRDCSSTWNLEPHKSASIESFHSMVYHHEWFVWRTPYPGHRAWHGSALQRELTWGISNSWTRWPVKSKAVADQMWTRTCRLHSPGILSNRTSGRRNHRSPSSPLASGHPWPDRLPDRTWSTPPDERFSHPLHMASHCIKSWYLLTHRVSFRCSSCGRGLTWAYLGRWRPLGSSVSGLSSGVVPRGRSSSRSHILFWALHYIPNTFSDRRVHAGKDRFD